MKTAYSYLRYSKPEQGKGDSTRRQTVADDLAKKNGWRLDTSMYLRDEGVSGFRGKNRKLGALAEFLEAVEDGRIKRGSVLIVEDIDRLSREDIPDAMPLFLGLISAGITVCVVRTGREYSRATMAKEPFIIMEALLSMILAHEESVKKQYRSQKWWEGRREQAVKAKAPITPLCPAWLILDAGKYKEMPEAVSTIKHIVRLVHEGHGYSSVVRKLVKDNVPAFTKTGRWSRSYLNILLHNRELLGEFHPHHYQDGKRIPVGKPIKGYYPVVLKEAEFDRLQNVLSGRKLDRDPCGDNVNNLFSGLLHTRDGSTWNLTTSIFKGKVYRHLAARSAVEEGRGKRIGIPYQEFENHMLRWLREITPADLAGGTTSNELDQLESLIADKDRRIDYLKKSLEGDGDYGSLIDALKGLEKQKRQLAADLEKVQERTNAQSPATLKQSQDLIDMMDKVSGEQLLALRMKLRSRIRSLVEKIVVRAERTEAKWRDAKHGKDRRVYMTVRLRSGTVRLIVYQTGKPVSAVWMDEAQVTAEDFAHAESVIVAHR